MLCEKPRHAEIRADYPEIKKVFNKYLGKIRPNISVATLCVSSNFMFQTHGAGEHKAQWSSKVDLEKLPQAPSINTRMGNTPKDKDCKVIPEIKEHSCYIMQTIRLSIFYQGSNTHIIKKSVAVEEGLK